MINKLISTIHASEGIAVPIGEEATKDNFFGYTCIGNLVSNIVGAAFIISAVLFFLMLVMGGVSWISSGGDKVKIEGAQKRISAALIGLTIVASSWAVYTIVLEFFGVDLSQLCPSPTDVGN